MGKTPASIFRDYDIRGKVGSDLSVQTAFDIGRAFGTILRRSGSTTVCVGRDGRLSSLDLEQDLIKGLQSCGIHVTSVGLGPTPFLYFAQRYLEVDAGVMITGSHNPPDENGFKLVCYGSPFFGPQIQRLYQRIEADDFVEANIKGKLEIVQILDSYRLDLLERLSWGEYPLKVAWDPGHGAAGIVLEDLLPKLPGTHHLLHGPVDGRFPSRSPDPTAPGSLDSLSAFVREKGFDLGIALDGDGDRMVVVDDLGHVWAGDEVLAFFVMHMLHGYEALAFVQDVKCSSFLSNWLKTQHAVPFFSKTGHVHVKALMKEKNILIGGEMSGHFFFRDQHPGYDDGLYAALRFLTCFSKSPTPLSQWLNQLPERHSTPELRLPCQDDQKDTVIEKVKAHYQEKGTPFHDLDGIRVEDQDGWWILRASQTQACLVARFESSTSEGLIQQQQDVMGLLRQFGLGDIP